MLKHLIVQRITSCITRFTEKHVEGPRGDESLMIVLGALMIGENPSNTLPCRLDRAFEYAVQYPDIQIITSGGQGKNEIIPEGEGMKNYLVKRGLDSRRILAETASTSTQENFAFTLKLMKEKGYDERTPLIYVTSDYHLYRAGQYAVMEGLVNARGLSAPAPEDSALNNFMRETVSLLKLAIKKMS